MFDPKRRAATPGLQAGLDRTRQHHNRVDLDPRRLGDSVPPDAQTLNVNVEDGSGLARIFTRLRHFALLGDAPDFISGRFPPRTLLLSFLDAFPWKQSVRDWDAELFHCSSSAQAHDVRIPPSWAFQFQFLRGERALCQRAESLRIAVAPLPPSRSCPARA